MKRFLYLFIAVFFVSPVSAQSEDIGNFISDVLFIAEEFSDPAADAAGMQASAGWFSSASALEKWDIRFSLHGNALMIPEKRKSFTMRNSDLKLLQIEGVESVEVPTAFGGVSKEMLSGTINFNGQEIPVNFDAIDGIGRNYVPHAFMQIAVGLSAGTEITVRAMPNVTIDGVTANTYGLGVKHNLNRYFNPYDFERKFQVALGVAYSKLNVEYEFEPQGAEGIVLLNQINVDADLFMAELIGSMELGFFEPFAAVGVTNSSFDYVFGGTGDYLVEVNNQVDKLEDSAVQFKGDLGFNLHFGRFRLSAMGTVGDFFNGNLGLHFRI
ncbi:DUF6588 family protein [Salinimicrobium oceani]|uniref:Type IX secretion system membrane protein, PorP/SprF family n=1 Tax=Salinimicrobium oceani TaxID=2722702 RepID=A0ABX1D109_9FLAO|nr:DUF6588 family protein [Salinimicrobium oceani]NJW54199.1 hypothetical protein [Salinimicrobium oceani]